jgi:hypothetical protein
MDPELGAKAQEMIIEDEKSTQILSPKAKTIFTVPALNKVVTEWNKVAPLFGIKDKYPSFTESTQQFPTEFTKLLLMVSKATEDAVEAGVSVPVPDLATITDDRGAVIFAANLANISKNRDFKDWLSTAEEEGPTESAAEPIEAESMEPAPPVSDDEFTQMIAKKMPSKLPA